MRTLAALVTVSLVAAPSAFADSEVELQADGFEPSHVTVDAGETLHFSNNTTAAWSITSDTGLFDSRSWPRRAPTTWRCRSPARTPTLDRRGRSRGQHHGPRPVAARRRRRPCRDSDPRDPVSGDRRGGHRRPPVVRRAGVEDAHHARLRARRDRRAGQCRARGCEREDPRRAADDGDAARRRRRLVWWNPFGRLEDALQVLRARQASPTPRCRPWSNRRRFRGAPTTSPRARAAAGVGQQLRARKLGSDNSQFTNAWNLNESVKRKSPSAITGIVDLGFQEHDDLPGLEIQQRLCPRGGGGCGSIGNSPDPHSNHVAGIIGAAYDNDAEPKALARRQRRQSVRADVRLLAVGVQQLVRGPASPAPRWSDKQLELLDLILRSRRPSCASSTTASARPSSTARAWRTRSPRSAAARARATTICRSSSMWSSRPARPTTWTRGSAR